MDAAIVELLLARGAKVNLKDNDDFTALMFASEQGHLEVVNVLLTQRANPNAINGSKYCTALIMASYKGHFAVVDALLQAGADPGIAKKSGETALIIASKHLSMMILRVVGC